MVNPQLKVVVMHGEVASFIVVQQDSTVTVTDGGNHKQQHYWVCVCVCILIIDIAVGKF